MTSHNLRWILLTTIVVFGCDKLFGKDDAADAEMAIPDAGSLVPETRPPTFDAGQGSPGGDTAPSVSIPITAPPDLTVEAPAVEAAVASFSTALKTRDLTTAAARMVPAVRTGYRTLFESASSDKLDKLAAALQQVDVTTLIPSSIDQAVLRAEALVALDGRTFHVGLLKVDNQWLLEAL